MVEQAHHIEKQTFLLHFDREDMALRWQKSTFPDVRTDMSIVLDDVFNKFIPQQKWVTIERIEIDLGTVTSRDLIETFRVALENKVKHIITEVKAADIRFLQNDGFEHSSTLDAKDVVATSHSRNEILLQTLLHFLEHGVLKGGVSRTIAHVERELVDAGLDLRLNQTQLQKWLLHPGQKIRVLHQLSATFSRRLFGSSAHLETFHFRRVKTILIRSVNKLTGFSRAKKTIRQYVMMLEESQFALKAGKTESVIEAFAVLHRQISSVLATNEEINTYRIFILNVLMELRKRFIMKRTLREKELFTGIGTLLSAEKRQPRISGLRTQINLISTNGRSLRSQAATVIKNVSPRAPRSIFFITTEPGKVDEHVNFKKTPTPVSARHRAVAGKSHLTVKSHLISVPVRQPAPLQTSFTTKKQSPRSKDPLRQHTHPLEAKHLQGTSTGEIGQEEYYILQAGLVLCWPYLEALFNNVGYTLDGRFITPELQERAVHLLGYIGTGVERLEEHQLLLQKLLAGWALEFPVVRKIWLTNEERREAEQMTESMIRNWTILKNTSVDSFRTSFLQRDGKIMRDDQGWRVIVEQKSFDMLLDHLPYSLSVIKLPWRNDLIKVDWA